MTVSGDVGALSDAVQRIESMAMSSAQQQSKFASKVLERTVLTFLPGPRIYYIASAVLPLKVYLIAVCMCRKLWSPCRCKLP